MPSFDDLDDSVSDDDVTSLGLDPNPTEAETDFEEQMSEVELRLEKAYYYRMLLKQNPFDTDSPIADEVWKDISKLLRIRLGELLGVVSATRNAPGQFSDEEAAILKSVASKLLKNASVTVQPKPPKKAPGLRKVSVAEVEAPKLRATAPVAPKAPVPGKNTITVKGGKAGAPRKILKKHINDEGREIIMDVTPQVKPKGIQPMAMPNIEMSNAHSAMQAAKIAASQDEGLIELVKGQG